MHRTSRFVRRAAVAAAIAGCAATAAFTATPGSAATPACTTSQLVVWLDTAGEGAAGSTFFNLEFTNVSARACTLSGFPGVSAVDLSGHQLGAAASRNPAHTIAPVTLTANSASGTGNPTATVVLRITDIGVYSTSACGPVIAAGLRVYPPNQKTSRLVPFPFRGCSRTQSSFLSVEAVQKGRPIQ